MVRTGELITTVSRAVSDDGSPVRTDIGKGVERTLGIANDEDGLVADHGGHEVSGFGQLGQIGRQDPTRREDAGHLRFIEVWRCVSGTRKKGRFDH